MLGFIQLTTEVAPGAGLKLLAIKNPDGTFTQVVAVDDSPASSGSEKYLEHSDVTTPGTPQDLISDTVPAGIQRLMGQVFVICRSEGSFVVTADGAIIGEGKTGPASPNAKFSWNPTRPLGAGVNVKVTFSAVVGTKPGLPVSAYLQASDVTV